DDAEDERSRGYPRSERRKGTAAGRTLVDALTVGAGEDDVGIERVDRKRQHRIKTQIMDVVPTIAAVRGCEDRRLAGCIVRKGGRREVVREGLARDERISA